MPDPSKLPSQLDSSNAPASASDSATGDHQERNELTADRSTAGGPGNPCFGCGAGNSQGMHLPFERDDQRQRIVGRFRLGPEYQGGRGFIHGGIVATVLDEVMSKVSRFSNVHTVTAELHVEYLKPVRVGQELVVEGFFASREGRQLYHKGEIRDLQGTLLARGKGRFVAIDPEIYAQKALAGDEPKDR